MKRYIRICPVCDTENPPDRVHCSACATLLAGVDFSLPRETPGAGEAAVPAEPAAIAVLADEKPAPTGPVAADFAAADFADANSTDADSAAAESGRAGLDWPAFSALDAR
ncbi:MAG: hypothetical protein WBI41_06560, partial [Azovibrio sp.]